MGRKIYNDDDYNLYWQNSREGLVTTKTLVTGKVVAFYAWNTTTNMYVVKTIVDDLANNNWSNPIDSHYIKNQPEVISERYSVDDLLLSTPSEGNIICFVGNAANESLYAAEMFKYIRFPHDSLYSQYIYKGYLKSGFDWQTSQIKLTGTSPACANVSKYPFTTL